MNLSLLIDLLSQQADLVRYVVGGSHKEWCPAQPSTSQQERPW